jgi:hypothetical protein
MRRDDINLQFKRAEVSFYHSYLFTHSFHGRQNLLQGGDNEVRNSFEDQEKKKSKSAFGGEISWLAISS